MARDPARHEGDDDERGGRDDGDWGVESTTPDVCDDEVEVERSGVPSLRGLGLELDTLVATGDDEPLPLPPKRFRRKGLLPRRDDEPLEPVLELLLR